MVKRFLFRRIPSHKLTQARILAWLLYITEGLAANYLKRLAKKDCDSLNDKQIAIINVCVHDICRIADRLRALMNTL